MDARRLYHRIDAWLRALSRSRYAALAGVLTGLAVLAASSLLGETRPLQAAAMGVAVAVAYYLLDPE